MMRRLMATGRWKKTRKGLTTRRRVTLNFSATADSNLSERSVLGACKHKLLQLPYILSIFFGLLLC